MSLVTTYTGNLSTNITSPDQIFTAFNNNLNKSIGIGILVLFFFVMFFGLKNNTTTKNAFATASFLTTIIAWLFWIINWIGTMYFVLFIIMSTVGVIILFIDRD